MIEIKNVSFTYPSNKTPSLKDINLTINDGEFIILLGSSGSGKTSMTRLINGLIPEFYQGELSGDVLVEGCNTKKLYVSQISDYVGSVFQDPHSQFFTTDTTSELAFACENAGMPREEIERNIHSITKKLNIEHLLDKNIFELSGGEKQMIAIASICAYSPKIIVLDEPSANLDGASIEKLRVVLTTLKSAGFTIIISEHRIHYLKNLCDRAIFVENGQIKKEISGDEFATLSNDVAHELGLRAINLEELDYVTTIKEKSKIGVELHNIDFYYDKKDKILNNLSIQIPKGEVIGVIGNNGVGKTTLLETICGLRKEKKGKILFSDVIEKTKARNKKTYLVMQTSDYQLFTENLKNEICLGIEQENLEQECSFLLKKMYLDGLEDRHPASLSGGQKQRLSVAVAYMKKSEIVCFDEPTSGLDYQSMLGVTKRLKELTQMGKTVFVVTHDYEFLINSCDSVLHLTKDSEPEIFTVSNNTKEHIFDILHRKAPRFMQEKNKKTPPLKMLLSFLRQCKGKELLAILFATISVGGAIVPYYCAFQIFDMFFKGNLDIQNVIYWVGIATIGFVIKALAHAISTCFAHISAYTVLEQIRLHVANKLMSLPLGEVQKQNIGKLKNLIVDHVETLELPLAHLIPEGFAAFVQPLAVFCYMLSVDWRLALISLVTVPIAMLAFMGALKDYSVNYENFMKTNDYMNGVIVEYVEGIEVVKAFNQSTTSYEKLTKAVRAFKDTTMNWFNATYKTRTFTSAMMPTTTLGVLPFGLYLYLRGSIEPVTIIISILLSMSIVGSLMKFTAFMNDLKSITYALSEVTELVNGVALSEGDMDNSIEGNTIELNNVNFSYEQNKESSVLNDVSFTFEEGKFYALVGPSGGGKSTIARLIARYWDVNSGEIKIGGISTKDISLKKLASLVSFVTQDNYLFNTTIFENIKMGNPNATDEQVYDAAKKAACDEFIDKLENGYNSKAGEAGTKLSGGERQRIAIARAILKNSPIVILDEATAFTDPENEAKIQQSIAELTKSKTLIMIAHRLSTIKDADEILLINKGTIEASAKHEELLQSSQLYQTMWQMHMSAKNWSVRSKEDSYV